MFSSKFATLLHLSRQPTTPPRLKCSCLLLFCSILGFPGSLLKGLKHLRRLFRQFCSLMSKKWTLWKKYQMKEKHRANGLGIISYLPVFARFWKTCSKYAICLCILIVDPCDQKWICQHQSFTYTSLWSRHWVSFPHFSTLQSWAILPYSCHSNSCGLPHSELDLDDRSMATNVMFIGRGRCSTMPHQTASFEEWPVMA